jgi:hypothetical protein
MSATETLRANLTAAGMEYGALGDYYTIVESRGVSWAVKDNYDNKTVSVHAPHWLTPEQAVALITGRETTAHMLSICDDDGVGHSKCGACRRTVGEWFKYCPWCGARFVRIERTYQP